MPNPRYDADQTSVEVGRIAMVGVTRDTLFLRFLFESA
jgi:hypothetical protein